jgi:hypothetical protein
MTGCLDVHYTVCATVSVLHEALTIGHTCVLYEVLHPLFQGVSIPREGDLQALSGGGYEVGVLGVGQYHEGGSWQLRHGHGDDA